MELMIDLKFYSERETFFSEYKVIRIGNIVAGGGLYLGVGKDNGDISINSLAMQIQHQLC